MSENGGLGLDVAGDEETLTVLQRILPELADTPLDTLRGQRLDANRLRSLVADDPVRDLLTWLGRPEKVKDTWPEERWTTFCEICRDTYNFDPEKDGSLHAARLLGFKEGPWATVWQRYVETFVPTPDLQSEDRIGSDPLPPGQVWTASPGGEGEHAGRCRIEGKSGPGSGVKVLNQPTPQAFKETVRYAEQLFRLPDDIATAVGIDYYAEVEDALVKALAD